MARKPPSEQRVRNPAPFERRSVDRRTRGEIRCRPALRPEPFTRDVLHVRVDKDGRRASAKSALLPTFFTRQRAPPHDVNVVRNGLASVAPLPHNPRPQLSQNLVTGSLAYPA